MDEKNLQDTQLQKAALTILVKYTKSWKRPAMAKTAKNDVGKKCEHSYYLTSNIDKNY